MVQRDDDGACSHFRVSENSRQRIELRAAKLAGGDEWGARYRARKADDRHPLAKFDDGKAGPVDVDGELGQIADEAVGEVCLEAPRDVSAARVDVVVAGDHG